MARPRQSPEARSHCRQRSRLEGFAPVSLHIIQRMPRAGRDVVRLGQQCPQSLVHERRALVKLRRVHRAFSLSGDHQRQAQLPFGDSRVIPIRTHALHVQDIDFMPSKNAKHFPANRAMGKPIVNASLQAPLRYPHGQPVYWNSIVYLLARQRPGPAIGQNDRLDPAPLILDGELAYRLLHSANVRIECARKDRNVHCFRTN